MLFEGCSNRRALLDIQFDLIISSNRFGQEVNDLIHKILRYNNDTFQRVTKDNVARRNGYLVDIDSDVLSERFRFGTRPNSRSAMRPDLVKMYMVSIDSQDQMPCMYD